MTEAMTTAISTAFSTVQTDVGSVITTGLPFALGIIGTVLAIKIGIKVFKSITAKA